MPRHGHAHFLAGERLDFRADLIGNRGIAPRRKLGLSLLLAEGRGLLRDCTLRDHDNRETAARFLSLLKRLDDGVNVVGNFRNQDDIRAARDARVEREPTHLVSHDLDNKDSAVRCRRGVNAVNRIGRNLNGTLKTEGLIRAVEIVVYGLRQRDNVESLLAQQVCRLLASVSAEHAEAVKPQLPVGRLHEFHLIVSVFIRHGHLLERLPAGAEQGAAPREYARKIIL